ncbi:MAG: sodium-dependent transporter, partial [Gemmatimonadota bacterium]|nr:sodium-dependent transporter [Gemmatimonadota bacterium]
MRQPREAFSSRWLMMLAMLGMAVGTGNIWRFPRIVAQNGGGEFIVAWVVFLFLWSIPLILVEFGAGRKTRLGPVGAFLRLMGPRWAWMGAFIAFVATAIMFYYSVVAGWTLRYIVASVAGEIPRTEPGAFWNAYTGSWWPVLTHGVAMGCGVIVVGRGVRAIERVARVLMPTLIVLVVVLAIRAVTLPGSADGLQYLFTVDWAHLGKAQIW